MLSSAIEAQAVAQKASYEKFCGDSEAKIAALTTDLAKWEAMKPVEDMNLEEALDAGLVGTVITGIPHPDKPSFWPHDEVSHVFCQLCLVFIFQPSLSGLGGLCCQT